ncbi:MAG: acyltransferase family protein [Armatimonadota bacterium]
MTAIQFLPRRGVATKLPYLDNIRGVAALYVAIGHIWQFIAFQPPYANLPKVFTLLNFGHAAVGIFIVLSGYCLMLPIAAQGHVEQETGWLKAFIRRRALRIYPAYIAAMIFSLALIATTGVGLDPQRIWTKGLYHFSGESIGSHLLLMHNLTPFQWTIDTPMWSVALEWQIYLLFGAVIVPLWKRVHPYLMLSALVVLTAWTATIPSLSEKYLWFVGLFFMGNIAACYGTRTPAGVEGLGLPSKLWKLAGLRSALPALLVFLATCMMPKLIVVSDIALGIGISGILVWLQRTFTKTPEHRVIRVLSAKPLATLGAMSYSIYLLHFPILETTNAWLAGKFTPLTVMAIQSVALLPIVLGISWLSYKYIELPFMRMGKRIRPEGNGQPSSNVVTP